MNLTLKFALSLIFTLVLFFILGRPVSVGKTSLPAIAPLLSPATGFWKNAEGVNAYQDIQLNIEGLSDEVAVAYDQKLVPHIKANNLKDAFLVQGYITASHRLFQMDIASRAAGGELSEILGDRTLPIDRQRRRLGIPAAAEDALNNWKTSPETYQYIEQYAKGINQYIAQLSPADYPLEYKLIGAAPKTWTPYHCALMMKNMSLMLSSREHDLEASTTLKELGRDSFDFIFPEDNPLEDPIIQKEVEWNFVSPFQDSVQEQQLGDIVLPPRYFDKPLSHLGSNNWAVSSSKTKNGRPILCNDPHLKLNLPSIWYELQIQTPETNTYGVSIPGFPGIIIGFNESIAWGMTNVGHDVMDWYTIEWTDEAKTAYRLDGKTVPVDFRYETIKVKDKADIIDTVRYTHWGPVRTTEAGKDYTDMAVRWLAHDDKSNQMATVVNLFKANSFEGYRKAIESFESPAQNIVFASKNGDIALSVQGKLPIKEKEQGRFVSDGSQKAAGWKGFIPQAQLPYVKNPERGFVSSANQKSAATDYPYYYNGNFEDFRGRYLNRKLGKSNGMTIEDMKALQNDNFSLKAEEALPLMLRLLDRSELDNQQNQIIESLEDWSYTFDKALSAPVYFDIWWNKMDRLIWDEIDSISRESGMALRPEQWRTIDMMRYHPEHNYFDLTTTPEKENATTIVSQAFKNMTTQLAANKAVDSKPTWGTHRKMTLNHLMRLPAFSIDVNVGGDKSALNANRNNAGPSWRMIVEMTDHPTAYGIYPGGQSGNPGSKYYDNMVPKWSNGEYDKLLFLKQDEALNEQALFTQTFK